MATGTSCFLRHGRRANAAVGDHPPRRVHPASARVLLFFRGAHLRPRLCLPFRINPMASWRSFAPSKVRLTQRKPHDDFCGLLPIGRVSANQARQRCRRKPLRGAQLLSDRSFSPSSNMRFKAACSSLPIVEGPAASHLYRRARIRATPQRSCSPGPARWAWRESSRSAPAADIRAE